MEIGTEAIVVTPPELIVPETCMENCGGLRKRAAEAALQAMKVEPLPPLEGRSVVTCAKTGRIICHAAVHWEGSPICDELGNTTDDYIAEALAAGAERYPIIDVFDRPNG